LSDIPVAAEARVVTRMADIDQAQWDALANPDPAQFDPFVSHAFLDALEASGSITADTGWLPQHLLVEDGAGRLRAAMPCYLKGHSFGEFVFDHAWADAYERAGTDYYPKLLSAVPVTPVPGRRLLVPPGPNAAQAEKALLEVATELTRRRKASSLHLIFMTEEQYRLAGAHGLLLRTGHQYHWANEGFACFDDFLGTLASRKRKTLKRERRDALASGITIRWYIGKEITEAHWDAFFAFYMDTGGRKWGAPYLNRDFFRLLGERLADRCLLVIAERGGRRIAGALNLIGGEKLYGRYWGCLEQHPFLHFEVCYYQAIDFAIAYGLKRVEAGAGGEHKLLRGYTPQLTYSAHWIAEPRFRRAIADFLARERPYVERRGEAMSELTPFKKVT
jgi:predicted N-acyltransferase